MKLHYALKEGLIDIRIFPTEWHPTEGKKNRVQIRLNGTPGVKIIDTNLGSKALLNISSGEMLLLDAQALETYAVDAETLINLNTTDALHALQN